MYIAFDILIVIVLWLPLNAFSLSLHPKYKLFNMLCEKKSIALKKQGKENSETWLILENRIKLSVASEH